MKNEIQGFVMGTTEIHSNKTGKDYTKINLVLEGEFVGFFLPAEKGRKIAAAKPVVECIKSGSPKPCKVTLETKFTQRGIFTDLVGLAE